MMPPVPCMLPRKRKLPGPANETVLALRLVTGVGLGIEPWSLNTKLVELFVHV